VKTLLADVVRSDLPLDMRREIAVLLAELMLGEGARILVPAMLASAMHSLKKVAAAVPVLPGGCYHYPPAVPCQPMQPPFAPLTSLCLWA
jgi:hypothetical protein